jgi:hypothetical protein
VAFRTDEALSVLLKLSHVRPEDPLAIKSDTGSRLFARQYAHAAGAPAAMRDVVICLTDDRKLLLQEPGKALDREDCGLIWSRFSSEIDAQKQARLLLEDPADFLQSQLRIWHVIQGIATDHQVGGRIQQRERFDTYG